MAKRKSTTTDAQEKTKKPKFEETSDAGSGDEAPRTVKKPKIIKKEESDEEEEEREDSDVINLGKNKRVTVREFKGNVLIDIREFYEDKTTKELKPGKKGISLTAEQWGELKKASKKIDLLAAEMKK